jgi:hypothetical protein
VLRPEAYVTSRAAKDRADVVTVSQAALRQAIAGALNLRIPG